MSDAFANPISRPADRGSGPVLLIFLLFVALPFLYIFSIGPAAMLAKQGYFPNDIPGFYAPVVWLHDHTFLQKPLEAYVGWWES